MNETIKSLTDQRVTLDTIKTALGGLPASRGKALAYTALELGRMYMGEVCVLLGNTDPYEATKKATDAKGIQDAVDTSNKAFALSNNEVINLNDLRGRLDTELTTLVSTISTINTAPANIDKFAMDCAASEAYRGLKESRMWLGIRLGELRDQA